MLISECNVAFLFLFPDYFGACTIYSALETCLQFILKLLVLRIILNQSIVFWTTVSEKAAAAAPMDLSSKPTGVLLISDSYHRAALSHFEKVVSTNHLPSQIPTAHKTHSPK
jgi:hypothetical protein